MPSQFFFVLPLVAAWVVAGRAPWLRLATFVRANVPLLAVLIIGAIWMAVRKKWTSAVITLVIGALVFAWYAGTNEVPNQVVSATPYVITLLVLSLSAQRLRMPKADGLPYRKGQGK